MMMWRLLVLPVVFLIIPPVVVVAFHLLRDRADGSQGWSFGGNLDSAPTSSIPALEAERGRLDPAGKG
jgi:hypothetical protein